MEGPWIIWWNNFYYMFYSSGGFSHPCYHLACARSASLSGPYEKSPSPVVSVDMARYKMMVMVLAMALLYRMVMVDGGWCIMLGLIRGWGGTLQAEKCCLIGWLWIEMDGQV